MILFVETVSYWIIAFSNGSKQNHIMQTVITLYTVAAIVLSCNYKELLAVEIQKEIWQYFILFFQSLK